MFLTALLSSRELHGFVAVTTTGGTYPRSIWINHNVIWNGENDELCETSCW